MENKNYVELIMEEFSRTVKNKEDALKVLEVAREISNESYLEKFLKDDLCIFNTKEAAFRWFNDEPVDILEYLRDLNMIINESMTGRYIEDIIVDSVLADKENYYAVSDDIHITYWM